MKKDIFFAMTPLHMLICEKVCKGKVIDLIVAGDGSNKSYYYYNRLKMNYNLDYTCYLLQKKKKNIFLKILYFIYFLFIFLKLRIKGEYGNIYIGNLNFKLHFLALYILKYENIITYDDGVANLIEGGNYSLIKDKKSLFINRDFIINNSIKHYTIFPKLKKNTDCYLKLFENNNFKNLKFKRRIVLFIGQPLHELDVKFDGFFVSDLISKIQLDLYFPHPRELLNLPNVKYVETDMVLEEYVIEMLSKSIEVKIIGFYSTALINIKSIFPELSVSYIYEKNIFSKNELNGLEKIFEKFNLSKIEVE